jgi:LPXTG-motif cell wall-anchored protein
MVDIRIPIGLMFTIIGILISVFGLATTSNTEMYHKSLDINVNIIMGILMLVFGLIMLFFARRKKKV